MSQPEASEEIFNTEDLHVPHNVEGATENNEEESEIIESSENQNNLEDPEENNQTIEELINENNEDTEHDMEVQEEATGKNIEKSAKKPPHDRITNLPIAKIKHIIKLDPDVNLVNAEAVFLVTKSTELFIKNLAKEAFGFAAQNKKKTIAKSHVELALQSLPVEL